MSGLDRYQEFTRTTAVYPGVGEGTWIQIMYCTAGLGSEAGEALGHAKKMMRDDGMEITADRKNAILRELGDSLWYIARAADELGVSLLDVAIMNMTKLSTRQEVGTLHGGDETRVRHYEEMLEGGKADGKE